MNSSEIEGFSSWLTWPNSALANAPEKPGTYVFRISGGRAFARVLGESDIVYIGTTSKGNGTVRSRLKGHRSASSDERYRLSRIAAEIDPLEVAWKCFDEHKDAVFLESTLLARYCHEHIEFPPANSQQSLKKEQDFLHNFAKCSPAEQERLLAAFERRFDDPGSNGQAV